jgi:hypothetical protein
LSYFREEKNGPEWAEERVISLLAILRGSCMPIKIPRAAGGCKRAVQGSEKRPADHGCISKRNVSYAHGQARPALFPGQRADLSALSCAILEALFVGRLSHPVVISTCSAVICSDKRR